MDWMNGTHISDFTKTEFSSETANQLGQTLWDFYMYQIHVLRKVHADPHPGNFLVSDNGNLIAIDFGCIKEVPDEFYKPYFELAKKEVIEDEERLTVKMYELEILKSTDSPKELEFFKAMFKELLALFTAPMNEEQFDFGSDEFWGRIANLGEQYAKNTEIRKMNANRGSEHFLYMNRTFFGLYNLLHDLKAKVIVDNYLKYLP